MLLFMDPERNRRFFTILLLCLVYIASSFIQTIVLGKVETTSTGFLQSATEYAIKTSHKLKAYADKTKERKHAKGDDGDRNLEDDPIKNLPKVYLELKSCLPRFICEVHAEGPGAAVASDLEKDILSLFRNYLFLEGPSSPVYSYQIAAHMGQLAAGLTPSPCHNMYPSCPLSKKQLLDLLAGVKSPKRKRRSIF